jgi:hypothetical protein
MLGLRHGKRFNDLAKERVGLLRARHCRARRRLYALNFIVKDRGQLLTRASALPFTLKRRG